MSTALLDLERARTILKQQLPRLRREFKLASLGIFGSYVRQEHRPDSDLDLLATFQEVPSLLKLIELENQLGDLLGVKVDLVLKDSLKPAIGQRILAEVVPV